MKIAVFLLLVPAAAWSQPLRVYSEFARIDASGKVTAPAEPREILSPAIARNAFSSFQVVVDVPQGTPYQLYIAQNPENAVQVTLYRENGERLERVEQPVSGNSTQVFWMDLWTARDAPVARIKVEPQLHVNNDWVIYPMEARVMSATVPPEDRESVAPLAWVQQRVCGLILDVVATPESQLTTDRLRRRNEQQDFTLATQISDDELKKALGSCDPPMTNPEWYFRIRDYLLRLR